MNLKNKTTRITLWLTVIIILVATGISYFYYSNLHPSTDDAYVQANVVNVAAQVTGPVKQVFVKNNQLVKKGQAIFTIDPAPFQLAVNKAESQLQLAEQQAASAQDAITTAKANVAQQQAQFVLNQKNADRILALVKAKQMAPSQGDEARAKLDVAKATLEEAKSQLQEAKQQYSATQASIDTAKASLKQAKLDLSYTIVSTPTAGTLKQFNLQAGTMVVASQTLFYLIKPAAWWVNANFKETQLERIRVGQPVTIKVDMYPNHAFKGQVQSISAGSDAAFSLLPPENTTGNWVKVTQRFQVKIIILNPNPNFPLRMGASSTVTVNTTK